MHACMMGAVPAKPLKSAKPRKSLNLDRPVNLEYSEKWGPSCWSVMHSGGLRGRGAGGARGADGLGFGSG